MQTITLTNIGKQDLHLQFPTKWNELLPAETLFIAHSLISNQDVFALRAEILLNSIEQRASESKQKLPKKWKQDIDAEQFFLEGNSLLDFLFKENELTNPPEAIMNIGGMHNYKVAAPAKGFASITCGEFEDCELEYAKFLNDSKMEHLASIASILWREKGKAYQVLKNDKLEKYQAERWLPLFMKLEAHRLYAIFIWYTGSKGMLPKIFPTMHEPDEDSKAAAPDPLSFTKCIHAGAGPKNGNRNQIRLMGLNEFMYDMEQEAVKAKELREQYKNAASK